MPQRPSQYITYASGLEAKHLHLGNIVHDFKKPNEYDPYIEAAYEDTTEPAPAWASSTPLENYALTIGKEGGRYQVVAATKGTKLEIKDPSSFFKSQTLSSTAAKTWLTAHLSAALSLSPKPDLWVLTGLILLSHSTWSSISVSPADEGKFVVGHQAPFRGEGVEQMRRLSVSEDVKPVVGFLADDKEGEGRKVDGVEVRETGKFPGLRGWAVRWERVDVEIGKEGVGNTVALKGIGEGRVLKVDLEEDGVANVGDEAVELGEEYWDKFLDAVDGFM